MIDNKTYVSDLSTSIHTFNEYHFCRGNSNKKKSRIGLIIKGKKELTGNCEIECYHDHRIAMSAHVAGLICKKPIEIKEFQWVDISFPEYLELMKSIFS